jgi:hypothetical protein
MVKSLCFLRGTSTTEDNYQSFLEFGLIIEKKNYNLVFNHIN